MSKRAFVWRRQSWRPLATTLGLLIALSLSACSVSVHSVADATAPTPSPSAGSIAAGASPSATPTAGLVPMPTPVGTSMPTSTPLATMVSPTPATQPTNPPSNPSPDPAGDSPPTVTPAPPAPTPTPAPSGPPACSNVPLRGFGLLWTDKPDLARAVGCPRSTEVGLAARVQVFENGFMVWLGTGTAGIDQSDWVLTMTGTTASRYRVPPDVPPWQEGVIDPSGAFKWVWDNAYPDQMVLGASQATWYATDGAMQVFDSGTMIWLKVPADGGKPGIYVVQANLLRTAGGPFQEYPDLSVQ